MNVCLKKFILSLNWKEGFEGTAEESFFVEEVCHLVFFVPELFVFLSFVVS